MECINSWESLPSISGILQYLGRSELIQLSKCCKKYRNKFEREVLKELSLDLWKDNNKEIYNELRNSNKIEKVLEILKTDLGTKLKFVNKFILNCEVSCSFAEIFIKLLPNIETLNLNEAGNQICCLGSGLAAILNGMEKLEHVNICDIVDDTIDYYSTNKKVFPKSIKSLEIEFSPLFYRHRYNRELFIYDTIDISYINLQSFTITSNRVLQNLSTGLPSLKKIEIIDRFNLDKSNIVAFIKANQQLKILITEFLYYSEEMIKTLLSSKCLNYWSSTDYGYYETEVTNLPNNYSIKYLEFHGEELPATLIFQIINACNSLETLDICYDCFNELDLLKFERKINILKLSYGVPTLKAISEIDASRLFNRIDLGHIYSIEKFVGKYRIDKLKNYKFIPLISGSCILELINKAN
jgi:hypothetical protein